MNKTPTKELQSQLGNNEGVRRLGRMSAVGHMDRLYQQEEREHELANKDYRNLWLTGEAKAPASSDYDEQEDEEMAKGMVGGDNLENVNITINQAAPATDKADETPDDEEEEPSKPEVAKPAIPVDQPTATTPPPKTLTQKLAPYAVGAALLGIPAAGTIGYLMNQPTVDTDTDTRETIDVTGGIPR